MKLATRILIAAVSLIAAVCLLLSTLLGAPSFWWVIAAALLVAASITGFFSAAVLAGLAIPPLTAITIASIPLDLWNKSSLLFFLLPMSCVWAGTIVASYISRNGMKQLRKSLVASCVVLASGVGVDRAFTNKVRVHSYEMQWAIGNEGPIEGPAQSNGERRVVIYRNDSGAICYDAIYSNELAEYVDQLHKPLVHVEYEGFYDFGKERGYNVRAIEGKLITQDARPVLHSANSEGGTLETPNSTGACRR